MRRDKILRNVIRNIFELFSNTKEYFRMFGMANEWGKLRPELKTSFYDYYAD